MNKKTYQCAMCSTELSAEGNRAVSYGGRILCESCCLQEEEKKYLAETGNDFAGMKKMFFSTVVVLMLLSFGGSAIHYVFLRPREVKVTVDDKERIAFYLTLAYEHGKESRTFKRQIKNILRLKMSYRHLINLLKNGDKFFTEKRYHDAIQSYQLVKNMLPDWDMIYLFIADCYRFIGKPEHAKRELEEAIELNPDGSKAYQMMGNLFASEGLLDDAILNYNKALFNDKKNIEVLLSLADLYISKKRFIKARELVDKANSLGADTKRFDSVFKEGF